MHKHNGTIRKKHIFAIEKLKSDFALNVQNYVKRSLNV